MEEQIWHPAEDYLNIPRIWLRPHDVIYACMPKAASSSVKRAVAKTCELPLWTERLPRWSNVYWDCCGVLYSREQQLESDKFVFTVIRHPFDRLVSCWSDRVVRSGQIAFAPYKDYSFPEFARLVISGRFRLDRHTVPMTWMHSNEGKPMFDFAIRFERLHQDWDALRQFTGIPLMDLPHANRSKHKPWQEYYDADLLARVARYYWEDLRNFGYDVAGGYTDNIPWLEMPR